MDSVNEIFGAISRMRARQLFQQIISFGLIVSTALMIWNSLKIVTGSESPIVVVLSLLRCSKILPNKCLITKSGSMEPAFYRGDLLFLYHNDDPVSVGEIVVYRLEGRDIPIVHRVLQIHETVNGTSWILTKGDNNPGDDRPLYYEVNPNLHYLQNHHIIGRAKGFMPYVGMVTIIMNDYPQLKFALIGILGLFVIANRE